MKRSIVSSALAVCGLVAIASSAQADVNDGTIQITGQITATTCQVNGSAPGAGAGDTQVTLNSSSVGNLASAGQTAGDKAFNITVGDAADTGCTVGTDVAVAFDPASPFIDKTSGRLDLQNASAAGSAKNVQVEIADIDGTALHLLDATSKSYKVDSSHTVKIPLIARFRATGMAEAGDVATNVGFQVTYP